MPDEVRREIVELGFPDDGYNYMSHLREIKAASEFYHNPKARFKQLPSDVKVCVLFLCFVQAYIIGLIAYFGFRLMLNELTFC